MQSEKEYDPEMHLAIYQNTKVHNYKPTSRSLTEAFKITPSDKG